MTAPVLNPQTCAVIQSVNESVGIGDIPLLTEGINILDASFRLRVVRWLLCDV